MPPPAKRATYIGWSREDRDLLVELRTQVVGMRDDMKEVKGEISSKINDHEGRIRILEKMVDTVATQKEEADKTTRIGGSILIVLVGILEFIINHVWH